MNKPSLQLLSDLKAQRNEVQGMREKFNFSSEKLKKLFSEQNEIKNSIRRNFDAVKELRIKRDKLTGEVKAHKDKREAFRRDIKIKIGDAKSLHEEKNAFRKKNKIYENPASLKKQIDGIEYKIETEGMEFEKEQKLRKKIQEIQKKLDEMKIFGEISGRTMDVENELNALKNESDEEHEVIQEKAGESQKNHEKMLEILKEVDSLRDGEKKIKDDIKIAKKDYAEIKVQLEEALLSLSEKGERAEELKRIGITSREHDKERRIAEKTRSIEEKIKNGQKLTTEDIIAWQAGKRD